MTKEQSVDIRTKMGEYIASMDWKSITTTSSKYVCLNWENATKVAICVCKGVFTLREVNYAPDTLIKVDGNEVSWTDKTLFESRTAFLVRYWDFIKKEIEDFFYREKCLSEKIKNFIA